MIRWWPDAQLAAGLVGNPASAGFGRDARSWAEGVAQYFARRRVVSSQTMSAAGRARDVQSVSPCGVRRPGLEGSE